MNEAQIGVIGQKYEDRKTEKSGVLTGRDAEKRLLTFHSEEDNSDFTVSFSHFHSNWRKAHTEAVAEEEVPVVEPAPVVEEEVGFETDDDKINDFRKTLEVHRTIQLAIHLNTMSLVIDGVEVLTAVINDGISHIEMLPDLYYYSNFAPHIFEHHVHFDLGSHRSVKADTYLSTFGDILQVIKEAALEINLYGYTVDE